MKRYRQLRVASSGLVLALSLGCAAQNPFAPIGAAHTDEATSSTSPYQQLANAFPNQRVIGPDQQVVTPTAEKPTFGKRILTSLDAAKDSITNALQPRRIPADDPVSLSTPPPRVGADLHYQAGRVHENNNDIQRARTHYERALSSEPNDIRSLVGLARVSDQAGDLARAESLYRQATAHAPENVALMNDLGLCFAKQGKLDAAIETLGQAVHRSPNSVRYRNNLAIVLVRAGRTDDALQQLSFVHGPAAAHYNVGFVLLKQGQTPGARQHLRLAVQANPQLTPAHELLAQLDSEAGTRPSYDAAPVSHRSSSPVQYDGHQAHSRPEPGQGIRSLPPL